MESQKMSMGLSSIHFAGLSFAKHKLNKQAWLGQTADGRNGDDKLTFARNIVKTMLAAIALGMSESILNQSTAHSIVHERGGLPLAQSEAIQWKLADAAVDTSAARLLTYRAAWSKDNEQERFYKYATMAKAYATYIARFHASEGFQILLPFLHNIDSSLTSFYADSKILETFDATNEEEKVLLSKYLGI
jgi:alkylation response protein AidB-like acyl-CoA dehydrogenase